MVELFLFGSPRCKQDGQTLRLPRRKCLALLAYLALESRPHGREELAAVFYPESAHGLTYLRRSLWEIRQALGSDFLPDGPDVTLAHHNLWVDILAFEKLAGPGPMRPVEDAAAASDLHTAVAHYAADFMAGFTLPDAPAFDEWQFLRGERLRGGLAAALQALIRWHGRQRELDEALSLARRWLQMDPLHEPAHRQLMRLYVAAGQPGEALRQYEACARVLRQELGLAPGQETEAIAEHIRKQELEQEVQAVLFPGPASRLYNFPERSTAFVGRQDELAEISRLLVGESSRRLVSLVGPGGVGKSRLAVEAGYALQTAFADGVCFVPLAGVNQPDRLVSSIAAALELQFSGREPDRRQLLAHLRELQLLLILDNFEQLLAAADLLTELLRAARRLKLLVTSREQLNLQAEWPFDLAGLPCPRPFSRADQMAGYSAAELFVLRARQVRATFQPSEANWPAIVQICRLVEGMPLGLELAASWVPALSCQAIATGICQNLDFLSTEQQDVPDRHRSLRAVFEHSWSLLAAEEQSALAQLSVFRGGFSRTAAEEVAGVTILHLARLVRKSLVTREMGGRYTIHELLRQFAAERLAQSAAVEAAMRERHCQYYCDLLHRQDERWHTAGQVAALAEVELEADNIVVAWAWAVRHGRWQWLGQAIDTWCRYHNWHGRIAAGETACRQVLDALEMGGPGGGPAGPDSLRLKVRAKIWQGSFSMMNEAGLRVLEQAFDLLRSEAAAGQEFRPERASAHHAAGILYYSLDRDRARQHLSESLKIYRELDLSWGISVVLSELGHLDYATGEYESALARLQEAQGLHQAQGDERAQLNCLNSLAWVYHHQGRLAEAENLRRQVIERSQQLKARGSQMNFLVNLAYTLYAMGKFEEAGRWAEKGLAICLEDGRLDEEGYARLAVAVPQLLLGAYDEAGAELHRALAAVRTANARGVEATIHFNIGCLEVVRARPKNARAAFEESYRLYEEVRDHYIGFGLSGRVYMACLAGDLPAAGRYLAEAIGYALKLRDYFFLVHALPGAVLFLAGSGQPERAVEVWSQAGRQPMLGNSKWFGDVTGPAIAGLGLPADLFDQACGRGREQDPWVMAEGLLAECLKKSGLSEIA